MDLSNSQEFILAVGISGLMVVLWSLRPLLKNNGLVDFGWPAGFTLAAVYYLGIGGMGNQRSLCLCSMYIICGLRFMGGWLFRVKAHGEDRRWVLWSEKWRRGEGLFGVRNLGVNYFVFYQAQNLTNIFLLSVPLRIVALSKPRDFSALEIAAAGLWVMAFIGENCADFQLLRYQRQSPPKAPLLEVGLWRYSRHPNYFFEFLLWLAYALFAWESAASSWDYLRLGLVPVAAYYFLVYFTGIPMTEAASLQKRGAPYRQYQERTSRFFLRFLR